MTLKEMTRTRSLKTGTFIVEFNTPGIGHILKAAGSDFAFLDTEHSGFGMDALKAALRYLEAAGLPTLVRVPSGESHHINRALDAGAEGVMVPKAESVADVRDLVQAAKYPPAGERELRSASSMTALRKGRWTTNLRQQMLAPSSQFWSRQRVQRMTLTPLLLFPKSTCFGSGTST